MVQNHLKRINAPTSWPIRRKDAAFIARPNTGAHSLSQGMSLATLFKEVMHVCKSSKEVVNVLQFKGVAIDGKKVKDKNYNVGLYDVIAIDSVGEYYRVVFTPRGKLSAVPADRKETELKPCKIIAKKILAGGRIQINCAGGVNLLVDKDLFKTGDTLVLDPVSKTIKKHIPFTAGVFIQIVEGKYRGASGVVVEVQHHETSQPDHVVFKTMDGREISTLKSYAYVIGEKEPIITLGEHEV